MNIQFGSFEAVRSTVVLKMPRKFWMNLIIFLFIEGQPTLA